MTLEKVLRGVVLTGVFALPFIPLIIAQSMFFPFITGKNFTFRIIVEIIFAFWLALAVVNPDYRPRRSWILYAFALFVLIIGLADILGVNPLKSIWSNFERMEGWITLAHLLALLIVTTSALSVETLWRRFWLTSIGVSVLIGFYGIFQLLGWITINQGGMRLDATFGNAIYLGIYMLFHLFITALMWQYSWREGSNRWITGIAYGSIMLLQTFILFFTASRGAMLGVIGGAFLSALLLVIFSSQSKNAWRASVGVVVGIVALTGVFFLVKDAAFMQRIVPLQRLASISFSETTTASRFMNANMAIKGVQERPLLGWGQENYNIIFNKYYDPNMYGQEQWFDRTHNIVFDWLVAGGLLGLLAYAFIYVAAMWALWRSGFSIAERSIITGLLAGYLFAILFVFDNITSYLLFIFVLGFIAVRAANAVGASHLFESKALPRTALMPLTIGAVALSGLMIWSVNWNAIAASRTLIQALTPRSAEQGGLAATMDLFKKTIAYDSFGTQEVREQLIQGTVGVPANSTLSAEEKAALFALAKEEMQKQADSAPLDARFPFFLGILMDVFGERESSIQYLEQALALTPAKQQIKFQLAFALIKKGEETRAIELLKSAYESAPQFTEPAVLYATVLVTTGQDAQADEVMRPVLERGEGADQRLISAYIQGKQFDKIAKIWEARIRVMPNDPQPRFALAASYHAMGDKKKAIEALEQAAKDIPAVAPQAESLIQQIKDGTIQVNQ